jgi:hypothetical protein
LEAYNSRINGQTILHESFGNYKQLQFILKSFQDSGSNFGNLLLYQDMEGKNPLELAINAQSNKTVDLILDYLSEIKMNNINLVSKFLDHLV